MSDGLPGRLTEFVGALRGHGLQLGPGETVDAAAAIRELGLADRELLRHGLAATLLRRDSHRAVFDAVFDVYFPAGQGAPQASRGRAGADPVNDLRARLADALAAADEAALARLAGEAVDALGATGSGQRPGEGQGGGQGSGQGRPGWSALRTLERLQPQTLIAGVHERIAAGPEDFTARLDRDEVRRRVERFRGLVRTEARRRSAETRGREQVARHAAAAVDQVDFLTANRAQLAELRRTVQPMSRKLAGRLAARRRRSQKGAIDIRRTLRRSMSTGGVPLRPAYRKRRPHRPEIVLLCDVSGSVAGFAHFTLMLVEALHDQFSKVRAFGFVDATDEITHLVAGNDADPATLARRIVTEAAVTRWDGHSDYGNALQEFADGFLDAVGPRTSVLVLGDARTNGGDPNLPALTRILAEARHAYWLNPEPRRAWGTGDSAANAYRELVEMHECRTADQLAAVVSRLLPI